MVTFLSEEKENEKVESAFPLIIERMVEEKIRNDLKNKIMAINKENQDKI